MYRIAGLHVGSRFGEMEEGGSLLVTRGQPSATLCDRCDRYPQPTVHPARVYQFPDLGYVEQPLRSCSNVLLVQAR